MYEVYISEDLERDARECPVAHKIMTTPIPAVVNEAMRDRPSAEVAAAVRSLLARLGIKARVWRSAPRDRITIVRILLEMPSATENLAAHRLHLPGDYEACWRCSLLKAAEERLEVLVVAAFPDLCNRSDYDREIYDHPVRIEWTTGPPEWRSVTIP